jgi:hypothetical protein
MTHRIPILNAHTLPDANGTVIFEPSSLNLDANDRYPHLVIAFTSQSAKHGFGGKFTVPKNYVGSAKVVAVWRTTATSGDVAFAVAYTAVGGDATESMDPNTDQEAPSNVTDTASATARRRQEVTITLTSGNLAVDDEVLFNFYRDGADGADTLAATAWLENLLFEYSDT